MNLSLSIIELVADLEKELGLLNQILYDINIYEQSEYSLLINLRFEGSPEHDTHLVGGLSGTVQEFAGRGSKGSLRSIKLTDVLLVFTDLGGFMLTFVVDPNYELTQYEAAIATFSECFLQIIDFNNSEIPLYDEVAVVTQTLVDLLSEEIHVTMNMGSTVTIFPFRLREFAEARATDVISRTSPAKSSATHEVYAESVSSQEASQEFSQQDAIDNLLTRFIGTFEDIQQVTLIRTTTDGGIEKYSNGSLSEEISEKLYGTVLDMLPIVMNLLYAEPEERSLDLDGVFIYFEAISTSSFLYIVMESKETLDLVQPLVDRIANTLSSLFPDDL